MNSKADCQMDNVIRMIRETVQESPMINRSEVTATLYGQHIQLTLEGEDASDAVNLVFDLCQHLINANVTAK